METQLFLGVMGVLAGFACVFAAAMRVQASLRKRWASMAAQGESPTFASLLRWRVRNGVGFLRPVARALMRLSKVSETAEGLSYACIKRGFESTPESVLSVAICAFAFLALACGFATGSIVGALAVPICGVAVLIVVIGSQNDKRQEAVREAVPSALESMSVCFGSGFTLLQTFSQVAEDVPDPLGSTFRRSAHILEMGGSADSALTELREGAHASELAFVAVALDVQHQSGGAMRQVLEAATDTVKGELALRRSLRVQTAQAKLSARVVVVMPFILVAAFSMASPDFLSPFFSSVPGYALLTLAIVMQVAGIVLVRRALAVEGVS